MTDTRQSALNANVTTVIDAIKRLKRKRDDVQEEINRAQKELEASKGEEYRKLMENNITKLIDQKDKEAEELYNRIKKLRDDTKAAADKQGVLEKELDLAKIWKCKLRNGEHQMIDSRSTKPCAGCGGYHPPREPHSTQQCKWCWADNEKIAEAEKEYGDRYPTLKSLIKQWKPLEIDDEAE